MNRPSRLAVLGFSAAAVLATSLVTAPAASAGYTYPYARFRTVMTASQVQPGPGDPGWRGSAVIKLYGQGLRNGEVVSSATVSGMFECPDWIVPDTWDPDYHTVCRIDAIVRLVAHDWTGKPLKMWAMLSGSGNFSGTVDLPPYYRQLLIERPERFRMILSKGEGGYSFVTGTGGKIAGVVERVVETAGIAG